MSLAVDTTKRSKKYVITYTVVGIACFVMFIVSILRYVYLNVLEPVPIFFYAMLVWILLQTYLRYQRRTQIFKNS